MADLHAKNQPDMLKIDRAVAQEGHFLGLRNFFHHLLNFFMSLLNFICWSEHFFSTICWSFWNLTSWCCGRPTSQKSARYVENWPSCGTGGTFQNFFEIFLSSKFLVPKFFKIFFFNFLAKSWHFKPILVKKKFQNFFKFF